MTVELTEQQKIKILNSDDIFNIMQEILLREEKIDQEKEHFWLIGLANNNRIQYIELISLGTIKAATVEPMNVFRIAVMKGSAKVIMVHNHPSGELQPSEADKDITDRLIQVGIILDVPVADHLIISTKSYLSFVSSGIFKELLKSEKWVPAYELVERIRKEEEMIRQEAVKAASQKGIEKGRKAGIKQGKEEGIQLGKKEMAKAMRKDNEPIDKIVKYTGLSKSEIEML